VTVKDIYFDSNDKLTTTIYASLVNPNWNKKSSKYLSLKKE